MSRDIYIASAVAKPINISSNQNFDTIAHRSPESFLPTEEEDTLIVDAKRTYEVCLEADQKMEREGGQRKRRIVSLFEANEVAKRVKAKSVRYGGYQVVINGGLVDEEVKVDILSEMGYRF
jgi:hypothetical protein